jgi:hypothetical protein
MEPGWTGMCLITPQSLIRHLDANASISDDGYSKPTLIPYVPTGTLQIQSNVTRIQRALKRIGLDGKPQINYYHSGVGTGSSFIDTITGGLLGTGISEVLIVFQSLSHVY